MASNKENIIQLDSVKKYNDLYGLETLHSSVSVVDLTKATNIVNHMKMNYGIYALYLKNNLSCAIQYGRKKYDYQEGTIVCFAPGQIGEVNTFEDEVKPEVYGIIFEPSFIKGTNLGKHIKDYPFFSYDVTESLHLSEDERKVIMLCLESIKLELNHELDNHSKKLIINNIELLLDNCLRFYERQFLTREDINKDVLQQFEKYINEYFEDNQMANKKLPTVKYFADKACLSPNYFGELIKKETGKTAKDYIQLMILEKSKSYILETKYTLNEISTKLGFKYPQHFCRFFKKHTGITPNEFRKKSDYAKRIF